MIVSRKCNICKVINNRVMNTHQNKVRRKRKPSEVKMIPERYAEQSFAFGDEGQFTSDGKQFEVSDESPKKNNYYYRDKIKRLQEQLKQKEKENDKIIAISNELKKSW